MFSETKDNRIFHYTCSVRKAKEENLKVFDVDGSYIHHKQQSTAFDVSDS